MTLPTHYGWVERHLRAYRRQRVNLLGLTGVNVVLIAVWMRMAYAGWWWAALVVIGANIALLIRAWRMHFRWGRQLEQVVEERAEWERGHG